MVLKVNDVREDLPDANMGAYTIPAQNSLFMGAIGSKFNGNPSISSYFASKFHEVLIFPNMAIGSKETEVHNYLKQKWGI